MLAYYMSASGSKISSNALEKWKNEKKTLRIETTNAATLGLRSYAVMLTKKGKNGEWDPSMTRKKSKKFWIRQTFHWLHPTSVLQGPVAAAILLILSHNCSSWPEREPYEDVNFFQNAYPRVQLLSTPSGCQWRRKCSVISSSSLSLQFLR